MPDERSGVSVVRDHWRSFVAATAGWAIGVTISVVLFSSDRWDAVRKWSEFYVLAATLIGLWRYIHWTAKSVLLQKASIDRQSRPLPVVERIEQESQRANVHFYAANIGPGVATNVALLVETELDQPAEQKEPPQRVFAKFLLNPLGSQQRMLLPDRAETPFRDGVEVLFALIGEGAIAGSVFRTFGVYRGGGTMGVPTVLRHVHDEAAFVGNLEDHLDLHHEELHGPLVELRADVLERQRRQPRSDGKGLS